MAELYPPLPADLVNFTEGGVSLLVGTASKELVPDCVRCVGVRVWEDACTLTVLLPAATSVQTIENLRANPRLALTVSHIPSHRTMQIKGTVAAINEGNEADQYFATRYRAALSEDLAFIGMPAANTLRLSIWPCWAVDVAIEVVFVQTPGPQAGVKMTPESRGLL